MDRLLKVYVSPGQVGRSLRILDVIVKNVVKRGGRFERGPEQWRLRLFMGKQPVEFRMTEAMKRGEREYTAEERTAKDFWLREKYDWHGSGILRFKIEPGEGLWRRHRKKRRDRLLRRVQDGRPFNTHIWS